MTRGISASILILFSPQMQAQLPAFDVASVRPTGPGITGLNRAMRISPGRFSATFENLMALISEAYGVPTQFISGGPGWAAEDPFDIEARAAGPADEDQIKLMLQALLVDRFQLKIHRETKNLSVYSLTMGKRSAKLTTAKEDGRSAFRWTPAFVMGQSVTMPSLASWLTRQLGQLVIDKTGLEGEFDFRVDLSPDGAAWTMANAAMALPGELGLNPLSPV